MCGFGVGIPVIVGISVGTGVDSDELFFLFASILWNTFLGNFILKGLLKSKSDLHFGKTKHIPIWFQLHRNLFFVWECVGGNMVA